MITCSKCSRQNEDHFRFCLGCGASLEEQRVAQPRAGAAAEPAWPSHCPTCSAPVQNGQRFCGTCGSKVDAIAPAASSPRVAFTPDASVPPAPAPVAAPAAPIAAPAGRAIGELVMIQPDGSSGDSVPLVAGDNVIGRSRADAAVLSRDPYLSPQHARFIIAPGAARVIDLNSHNGVYFRLRERTELRDGDMLRVGHEVLRFTVLAGAAADVPAPADGTTLSGSPTAGAWGRLERISAPNEASFTFLLRGAEQILGRERGDILFRDDGYVSGRHARIFTEGGRYFVEDLQSSNGTFLRIRGERTISNGDLLLLGQQPFRLVLN